jgi:hypothetical protein
MPWRVFVGSMLAMISLFIAFLLNYTIIGAPYYTDVTRPPFGREALQPISIVLAAALLILGLFLVYTGLRKMETK